MGVDVDINLYKTLNYDYNNNELYQKAYEALSMKASTMGANAVLGFKIDFDEITVVATGLGDDKKDNKADVLGSLMNNNTDGDEAFEEVMSFFNN